MSQPPVGSYGSITVTLSQSQFNILMYLLGMATATVKERGDEWLTEHSIELANLLARAQKP